MVCYILAASAVTPEKARIMKYILLGIILLGLLPLSSEAKQKLYKWVDKDGVTHYSAQPPVDQKVDTINITTGYVAPPPPPPARAKLSASQAASATPPEAESLKDPEKCKKVRGELEKMRIYPRIRVKDSDTGELRYLSPEEKAERVKRTEQQEKAFCN